MRSKHISLWKGEVVIIACGGACLGAAEDQNSLLRDAALHVRARTCPSTLTHTLPGCFSRVGSVVCSGFLGTRDLLYSIAEENRDLSERVQAALPCFKGFTTPPLHSLVEVVFTILLAAVMRSSVVCFQVHFLLSTIIKEGRRCLTSLKLMTFNSREMTQRADERL